MPDFYDLVTVGATYCAPTAIVLFPDINRKTEYEHRTQGKIGLERIFGIFVADIRP
ncbi:MAG: hypothetical protein SFZ02_08670 [bacterium]|nr:hypothetical protein [bacterium]